MQVQPQPIPYVYAASPYGAPAYGTVAYQTAPLDVDWFNAWPRVRSILLAVAMLLSSAAVIGLDTTNIIIESNKPNGTSKIGLATGKVAAGIWCGSVSLAAAIFIIAIAFARNKRVAATFALFAVTLALLLAIVLVGLVANALQNSISLPGRSDEDKLQDKLIIAILTTGSFIVLLCIAFVILYIRTFFSPYTRPTLRYEY